jgi:hypothetical protein
VKAKALKIILALVLVLGIALVTATPAVADGPQFASGAAKTVTDMAPWGYPPGTLMLMKFQMHVEAGSGSQPGNGSLQLRHHPQSDVFAEIWFRVHVTDAKIVQTAAGVKGLWYWGVVIAGSPELVGRFQVGAVYENGGIYAMEPIADPGDAQALYDSGDTGLLMGPFPIEQGRIVIK